MEARDASKGAACFERLIEESRERAREHASKVEASPDAPGRVRASSASASAPTSCRCPWGASTRSAAPLGLALR